MRYSLYGNTGKKISALGFGCMRLPMKDGKVVRGLSTPMLRRAVELGVNFFDTAIGYCNGDSQAALGDALEGIRDRVFISTKNHLRGVSPSDWRRELERSLRLLKTDYIDLYNHHGMGWDDFVMNFDPEKGGLTAEMLKVKEEGLVRHIGFSFHDAPENLKKICDTGYYESVILQYNLLDQANDEAMRYARSKGMAVTVMGPVGGGRLGLATEQIRELTGGAAESTVEAALRFVWSHPAVNVALSGMEDMRMLEENVAIENSSGPFSREQLDGLNGLVAARKKKSGLYCTACKYCIPACGQGVQIPENLDLLNQAKIFGLGKAARERYGWLSGKAVACVNCGKCVPLCPQKIDIPARLRETALLFDPDSGKVVLDASVDAIGPDGKFEMKLEAFNFSDQDRDITVAPVSADKVVFEKQEVRFKDVKAMARRKAAIDCRVEAEGRHLCSGKVRFGNQETDVPGLYDFILVKEGLSDDWASGYWCRTEAKAADFSGDAVAAGKHGLAFRLEHDKSSLVLLADVKDDFLYPGSAASDAGRLCDGLEVYLDARQAKRIGIPKYEKGVRQVMVYPGTPGKFPGYFSCPQGIEGIKVSAERTQTGYRLKAVFPFESFCVEPGIPEKIGFDVAVNSADSSGNRVGQFVFSGTKQNWQDASNWMEVWIK